MNKVGEKFILNNDITMEDINTIFPDNEKHEFFLGRFPLLSLYLTAKKYNSKDFIQETDIPFDCSLRELGIIVEKQINCYDPVKDVIEW